MGIHGLWRLLEPAGRDVTLESLENKVLAIDVSLWLHQAQQGQSYGASGASAPHAHLLTLFHRISKLLFYRVKPVFIFDGIAPELKKKTIFARNQRKQAAGNKSKEMRQQLLLSLAKSEILKTTQSPEKISPKKRKGREGKKNAEQDDDNLFVLPSLSLVQSEEPNAESDLTDDEDDSLMSYYEVEEETELPKNHKGKGKVEGGWKKWNTWIDPHEVDLQSKEFQSLPIDVRHEILTDLKEARKQSSWGRLHKMPKDLGNFSNFQMSRLLHRRKVQEVLEKTEEEVASSEVRGTSLKDLEAILAEKGIGSLQSSQRIASDESKGFILLSGLKDQKKVVDIGDEKMDVPVKLETVKEEEESIKIKEENYSAMKKEDRRIRKFLEMNEVIEIDSSDSEILEAITVEEDNVNDTETALVDSAVETSKMDIHVNKNNRNESSATNYLDENSCDEDLSQGEIMAVIKAQMSETDKVGIESIGKVESEASEVVNVQSTCVTESDEELNIGLERISELQKQEDCGLTQEEVLKIISEQRNPVTDVKEVKEDKLSGVATTVGENKSIAKELIPMNIPKIICEHTSKVTSQLLKPSENGVKVVFDVSGDSDSEGSSFLEVEECEEVNLVSSGEETSAAVPDPPKSLLQPTPTVKKDLEVVINLDAESDDDIFADVFEGAGVEEDKGEDVVCDKKADDVVVSDVRKNEGVHDESNELDESNEPTYNEKHMEEDLDSESDSDSKVMQDKGEKVEEKKEQYNEMTPEERRLMTLEMRKLEREASGGVTEKARLECQELLGLFGVPWVVAPYEAEAQCAFFESLVPDPLKAGSSSSILLSRPLVEGTVTEDSDVWAFGASVVYRHVFDRRVTRVRVYSKQEIQRRVGLSRVQIIQLALLTGSDYTVGLPGIGTVTALEVLAAFPGDKSDDPQPGSDCEIDDVISGLQHFANWWRRVEANETNRTPIGHSYFDPPESVCAKLKRRLLTCWRAVQAKQPGMSLLPPTFPSRAVVMAYLRPSVDESRDTFSWRKPDEEALRSYAKLHFGWTPERIDSVLRPLFVRLKLSDRVDHTQTSLHSYFSHINAITKSVDLNASSNLGFRTQKALERIAGKCQEVLPEEELGTNEGEKEAVVNASPKKSSNINDVRQRVKGNLLRNKSVIQNMKSKRAPKVRTIDDAGIISDVATNKKRADVSEKSPMETGFESSLCSSTKIPQREKDKQYSLQSKMKAIEVMRKMSLGSGKRAAPKRSSSRKKKLRREEVKLSESSGSD